MNRTTRGRKSGTAARRGNVLILTAVLMIVMMGFLAFAIDLGYMFTVRTELQRSADAAAIAAAWELLDESTRVADGDLSHAASEARTSAESFAAQNPAGNMAPLLGQSDVTVGFRNDIFNESEPILVTGLDYNTVRVRIRRTSSQNGEVPLFFAPALGIDGSAIEADATAALQTGGFRGFGPPRCGEKVPILPFALDQETWHRLRASSPELDDNWKWDEETDTIVEDSDGRLEVNLYPQSTGSPGNRGTVDIGSNNNNTDDIARQILEGIRAEDLEFHGGNLELDCNNELPLNGDTGISAGFADELAAIKGQRRIIPIFSELTGNGNNAQYTIVHFAGVRIMDVKLTGPMNQKRVLVQPACLCVRGAIPAEEGTPTSSFIYSPVVLVE
jgi:Flp pilus assembly protein TadG